MAGQNRASVAKGLSGRRIVHLALVTVVVAAVVALAVTRTGVPASAMRLLTGDAWLANASAGTVSHVNGYTGGTDAQSTVGKAGDPFEVVQRPDGAFVLDLRTGRLSRLDDSKLSVTTAVMEPKPAEGLQVITGTNATWILDRSSGVLQQVSPVTLKPLGHQVALGGTTGPGVVDASGSVWVPLGSIGQVAEVSPGGVVVHRRLGRAGDDIEVADTSAGVWAVDPQAKTAESLSAPSAKKVTLPALPKAPLVGASGSSPDLVLVSGSQVLGVDTAQPSLSSLALPTASSVTQVAVSSNDAYLLDPQARRLDTVHLSPIGVAASTAVPAGSDQLVEKDQLLFVNSTTTPQALVVNPNGTVTNVNKYTPHVSPRHVRATPATLPTANTTPATSLPSASTLPPVTTPTATGTAGTGPPASFSSPGAQPASSPTSGALPTTASTGGSPPVVTSPAVTIPSPTLPPATAPRRIPPTPTGPPPPRTTPPTTTAPTTAPPTTPPTTAPITTTTAPHSVPGAPTVTGVTAGKGQVTVTWSAPASDGGTPVLSYRLTGSPVAASTASVAAANTSATLTGIANGTHECVQVQAVNAVGGGPLSPAGQSCATTPSPPGGVTNLSVTATDSHLTVSWGAAGVPAGSPPVTGYQVSVGGTTHSTSGTSITVSVPAWTNEAVKVYATNSVGSGPTASGSGGAWTRTGTVTCFDNLSGDHSVQNDCSNPGGAWIVQGSNINWINPQGHLGTFSGNFEYLCSTYETGSVSGDTYAISTSAAKSSCQSLLPNSQDPTQPHVIAAVSTSPLPGGQHICEYKGTTTTTNGTFTDEELTICGSGVPGGLSGATQINNFYT